VFGEGGDPPMSESAFQILESIDKKLDQMLCQACHTRRGTVMRARYRLKEETTEDFDANAKLADECRDLSICGWCLRKTDREGYMSNGRITIMEVLQ